MNGLKQVLMLTELKKAVWSANLHLAESGLAILTWGNVSGFDRKTGMIVIKPSGINYEMMKPDDMVVVNIDGKKVEGKLNPSSDTMTHVELYRNFPAIGGIVHTHSPTACGWAQSGRDIPAMGTTHADTFYGDIPCTRKLTATEVETDYELNTAKVIIERFSYIDPIAVPGVLVNDHGPFTWGEDPSVAVVNAMALEEVARIALFSMIIAGNDPIDSYLLDKHYLRKHGKESYYGQKKHKK